MQINNKLIKFNKILETGTNTDGTYIKYEDGTLVCYGDKVLGITNCNSAVGSVFYTPQLNIGVYPINFTSIPTVNITIKGILGIAEFTSQTKTEIGKIYLFNGSPRTGVNIIVSYYAIGRWK